MASHQGKRRIEGDDTALTGAKLRSRSQDEEQQDEPMASTPADPVQGFPSPPTQKISDVQPVGPSHPETEIMRDMLSDEESAELNRRVEALLPWKDSIDEDNRALFRGFLLQFLSRNYNQMVPTGKSSDQSSISELLDTHPWLNSSI
jgi:hypothetical protein